MRFSVLGAARERLGPARERLGPADPRFSLPRWRGGAGREQPARGRVALPRKTRPGFRGLGRPAASHCARAWGPRRRPGGGVSWTRGRAAWQGGPAEEALDSLSGTFASDRAKCPAGRR